MDGCLAILHYVLFNSISVISGQWMGGYKRLCAMELQLHLERVSSQAGIKPGTARSAGQRLTH